ncbi:MAG: 2-C-methyl-D-erythritol 4-phosphate cytidylyltransferase [Deltaproteobacteria bacterium]|nr:2-C-methyl-D-erythritol 4-phosphate cytidylyltransferase [Deltaproteobacteria bacterium]
MDKENRTDNIEMKTVAIIPAAGAGVRMGADRAKQFMGLNGRPLLSLTLERFQACAAVDSIILVVPPDDIDYCRREIVDRYRLNKVEKIVAGGERRQDSVRFGIEAAEGECGLVVIHDGARPLIEPYLIEKAVAAARKERAVITAMPAKETVKEIDREGYVIKTYDRKQVWLVQTPQVFRYEDILSAHQQALSEGWEEMTDDALLVEKMGIPVKVIPGSENNIKVTTPHDRELVRFLLNGK